MGVAISRCQPFRRTSLTLIVRIATLVLFQLAALASQKGLNCALASMLVWASFLTFGASKVEVQIAAMSTHPWSSHAPIALSRQLSQALLHGTRPIMGSRSLTRISRCSMTAPATSFPSSSKAYPTMRDRSRARRVTPTLMASDSAARQWPRSRRTRGCTFASRPRRWCEHHSMRVF